MKEDKASKEFKDDKNNLLNSSEKAEIATDVKAAFNKAKGETEEVLSLDTLNSIDKTKDGAPDTLSQEEIDKVVGGNIRRNTKKKSKLPIFITVFLILLIFSSGIYWYLANNPKTIFIRSMDVIFNNIMESIEDPKYEITKGNIDINYNSESKNNTSLKLNQIGLKANYITDSINKISKVELKTTYEQNHLIDATIYKEEGKTYFKSEDLLDKYIEFANDDKTINYDAKDLKTILKSLNAALINSLDGQKFSGSKVELMIADQKIKTYQASLVINKDNIGSILDSINDTLQNDTRFLNAYSNIFGIKSSQIKKEIDNYFKSLKNESKTMEDLTISIYTKGFDHEFVKLELSGNNRDQIDNISITALSPNKYDYLVDIKSKQEKTEGTFEYKTTDNSKTLNLTIKISNNNQEVVNGTLKIKTTEEEANKIQKEDVSKNVISDKLTEEEKAAITYKLQSNPILAKFIAMLS